VTSAGPGYWSSVRRVLDLSIGEMLWSRRTLFMALLVAVPIIVALAGRVMQLAGTATVRVNGADVGGAEMFGMLMWVFFVRFSVPVLGVFYGTALIADEVEDKTITYLFTRPVPRGAVLVGKYLSYLACSVLVVLPATTIVYFLVMPLGSVASTFGGFAMDLGVLALGLAAYGALFALAGALLTRPLIAGLAFVLGWEPLALLMPGYLGLFTVARYLQALIPQPAPADGTVSFLRAALRGSPSVAFSLGMLFLVVVVALGVATRAVERREYVLEQ
jgi:ABC-type transport system involved in multi-copper enzyme maturation permease subunit